MNEEPSRFVLPIATGLLTFRVHGFLCLAARPVGLPELLLVGLDEVLRESSGLLALSLGLLLSEWALQVLSPVFALRLPFTEVLEALLSRLRQCGARNDAIALGCGTASALLDLTLLELRVVVLVNIDAGMECLFAGSVKREVVHVARHYVLRLWLDAASVCADRDATGLRVPCAHC